MVLLRVHQSDFQNRVCYRCLSGQLVLLHFGPWTFDESGGEVFEYVGWINVSRARYSRERLSQKDSTITRSRPLEIFSVGGITTSILFVVEIFQEYNDGSLFYHAYYSHRSPPGLMRKNTKAF